MTAPSFQHEQLRLNDGSIRLVQIHGGSSRTAPLSLRITQFSTVKRPPYAAISYVWGALGKLHPITINGKPFSIRPNLWHLLLHLRQRGESRFLWVDALCINQSDRDERNFHVQFMSRIYEEAELAIVWLGLPRDDRREARAIDFVIEMADHRPGRVGASFRDLYLTDKAVLRWTNLLELFRCTYWSRTWIIQEFLRARKIEVLCGTAKLDWTRFDIVYSHVRPLLDSGSLPLSLQSVLRTIFVTMPSRLTARRLSRTASLLRELLHEFYDARCTLPRDKVYGMLGIAEDCGQLRDETNSGTGVYRGPVPDYAKHIVEVYFDVLTYLRDSSLTKSVAPLTITLLQKSLNLTEHTITQYTHALPPSTLATVITQTTLLLKADYISTIAGIFPSYTSSSDLRQKLTSFDWSPYVGFEVVRPRTPTPTATPTRSRTPTPLNTTRSRPGPAPLAPRNSSSYFSSSSSSSTTSQSTLSLPSAATERYRRHSSSSSNTLSRQVTQTTPLPEDLISSTVKLAETCDFPALLRPLPQPTDFFHLSLALQESKNTSTNPPGSEPFTPLTGTQKSTRPTVFIDASPLCQPLRLGFAITHSGLSTPLRRGDVILQFAGLNPCMTLLARRVGSSGSLRLIGRGVMVGHCGLRDSDGKDGDGKKRNIVGGGRSMGSTTDEGVQRNDGRFAKEAHIHPACMARTPDISNTFELQSSNARTHDLMSPCLIPRHTVLTATQSPVQILETGTGRQLDALSTHKPAIDSLTETTSVRTLASATGAIHLSSPTASASPSINTILNANDDSSDTGTDSETNALPEPKPTPTPTPTSISTTTQQPTPTQNPIQTNPDQTYWQQQYTDYVQQFSDMEIETDALSLWEILRD